MPVMDKLRKCAEKLGYRLNVPPELEHVLNEAYDSVFGDEDEEKPETQGTDNERRRTTNRK